MAKAKKGKAARSPFTKGRVTSGSSGTQFLGVKDGESMTFAPLLGLDELDSARMHEYWEVRPAVFHPCIGMDCPGCAVGNEARFKGYLPVLQRGGEVGIYAFTISIYNQLEELEDSLKEDDPKDSLKGVQIRVSRKGTGLTTRYTVTANGKRVKLDDAEVPDFIEQLGPTDIADINAMLERAGIAAADDDSETSDDSEDSED